jgi:hypothetical protein
MKFKSVYYYEQDGRYKNILDFINQVYEINWKYLIGMYDDDYILRFYASNKKLNKNQLTNLLNNQCTDYVIQYKHKPVHNLPNNYIEI